MRLLCTRWQTEQSVMHIKREAVEVNTLEGGLDAHSAAHLLLKPAGHGGVGICALCDNLVEGKWVRHHKRINECVMG